MITLQPQPRLAAILACVGLLAGSAAFGQTSQSLQLQSLAGTCASCHGTDGRAVQGAAMVQLAGLPKDYIVTQMQAFRDGTRPATVMHQIAKGYDRDQIDALATYFSSKK